MLAVALATVVVEVEPRFDERPLRGAGFDPGRALPGFACTNLALSALRVVPAGTQYYPTRTLLRSEVATESVFLHYPSISS